MCKALTRGGKAQGDKAEAKAKRILQEARDKAEMISDNTKEVMTTKAEAIADKAAQAMR
jgi:vacuolar-type H+-ATPase subunit E/Vma4